MTSKAKKKKEEQTELVAHLKDAYKLKYNENQLESSMSFSESAGDIPSGMATPTEQTKKVITLEHREFGIPNGEIDAMGVKAKLTIQEKI